MDYKEKYEQALEVAQRFYNNSVAITKKGLEDIFPELAGSEDERIRKRIIDLIKEVVEDDSYHVYRFDEMIAWLEKQGQDGKLWFYRDDYVRDKKQAYQDGIDNVLNNPQKYGLEKREIKEHDVCDTCDEKASCINPCPMKLIEEENPKIICWSEEDQEMQNQVIEDIVKLAGPYVCYHKDVDWLKSLKDRVQPQPKWSEEDEHRINDTIYFLETAKKHYASTVELDACIDWLKPLKYRVQPQPKWSEEDDRMYNRIVSFIPQHLTAESYTACINWLKSLRPQSQWKPSDMELEVLRLAAEKDGTCLMGLYEQLKKLREE